MKEIDFSIAGGFPLEQETLARLQTAYKDELYDMLKQHIGIKNNQNYIISEATSTSKGWLAIQGTLYAVSASNVTPKKWVKTTVTKTALRFGNGNYRKVYTDYTAEYVVEDEFNSPISSPDIDDTTPNLITYVYYELANFKSVGFLPIDGSKPMEGDLSLAGKALCDLDVLKAEIDTLALTFESKILKLGHPTEGIDSPGRALVDKKNTSGENTLHINYGTDWDNTAISGEIELSHFKENSTVVQSAPLVVNTNGILSKGNPYESIPVGLIALWYTANGDVPAGWVDCEVPGTANGNTLEIPGMADEIITPTLFLDTTDVPLVKYIIYVGLDAPTLVAGNDILITLDPGQTSYDATALAIELSATVQNLNFDNWEQISGPAATITSPNAFATNVTGSLAIGVYVFKATANQISGTGTYTDTVTIRIEESNVNPIIHALYTVDGTDYIANGNAIELTKLFSEPLEIALSTEISDPDGDNANLTLSASLLSGITEYPLNIVDLSATNSSQRYFGMHTDSIINVDEALIYQLKLKATDEDGGITESIFDVNITEEPKITAVRSYLEPVVDTTLRVSEPYLLRGRRIDVEGHPFQSVDLLAKITSNSTISGSARIYFINTSNTVDTTDYTFNSEGPDLPFNVVLDTDGFAKLWISFTPDLADVTNGNIDNTYELYANIALASNENNSATIGRVFDAYGDLDTEIIDDTSGGGDSTTGGGGGCFDIESYVSLASGSSKKLKNINIGDKLIALDFPNRIDESKGDYLQWDGVLSKASKAEVTVVGKTTYTATSYYKIITTDGKTIKVTEEHPLLASQDGLDVKWIRTKNILPSMHLVDRNGQTKKIKSIEFINQNLEVALLDVESIDNYLISGIVAHNRKFYVDNISDINDDGFNGDGNFSN